MAVTKASLWQAVKTSLHSEERRRRRSRGWAGVGADEAHRSRNLRGLGLQPQTSAAVVARRRAVPAGQGASTSAREADARPRGRGLPEPGVGARLPRRPNSRRPADHDPDRHRRVQPPGAWPRGRRCRRRSVPSMSPRRRARHQRLRSRSRAAAPDRAWANLRSEPFYPPRRRPSDAFRTSAYSPWRSRSRELLLPRCTRRRATRSGTPCAPFPESGAPGAPNGCVPRPHR